MPPSNGQDRYLRNAQVAEILGVNSKTIQRWTKEGKLPHLRTLGGHFRYEESEIREIAARQRREATPR
jgi:excisionase family DNA binding protein